MSAHTERTNYTPHSIFKVQYSAIVQMIVMVMRNEQKIGRRQIGWLPAVRPRKRLIEPGHRKSLMECRVDQHLETRPVDKETRMSKPDHMVVRHCREMGFDVRHRCRRETLRIAVQKKIPHDLQA